MDKVSELLATSAPYLSQFDETTISPSLDEWPGLVEDGSAGDWAAELRANARVTLPDDLRKRAREELLSLMNKTRQEAAAVSAEIGVSVRHWSQGAPLLADAYGNAALSEAARRAPLILAGHQPVIYHPGILLKTLLARDLARTLGGRACNIGIDTDDGDCGALAFPHSTTGGLRREGTTLSRTPGIFFTQRIAGSETIQALERKVSDVLRQMGRSTDGIAKALDLYRRAAETPSVANDVPLSTLNCLVRSQLTGTTAVPEIPLSEVSRLPAVLEFFRRCLIASGPLVAVYNETLAAFRTDRKIKNPANPFPSLAVLDGLTELPFWIVDPNTSSREVAHLAAGELGIVHGSSGTYHHLEDLLAGNRSAPYLTPRGMLITTTFRVLFADLFIHGLGGGKYDRCTDIFINSAFGMPPSPFVVASGTVRLFRDEVARYDELKQLFESLRSWRANIPLLLEKVPFDEDHVAVLEALQREKSELLKQLQTKKKGGESAKEEGIALKAIEAKVDEIVTDRLDVEKREYQLVDEGSVAVLREREYPYFFFPEFLPCGST